MTASEIVKALRADGHDEAADLIERLQAVHHIPAHNLRQDAECALHMLAQNLKPNTTAWGWVIDLARYLNLTDPCPRCEGTGTHRKHRNCNHAPHDSYLRGCYDPVQCKACHGAGRILRPLPAAPRKEQP